MIEYKYIRDKRQWLFFDDGLILRIDSIQAIHKAMVYLDSGYIIDTKNDDFHKDFARRVAELVKYSEENKDGK